MEKNKNKGSRDNEELEATMAELKNAANTGYIEARRKEFERLYDDTAIIKLESDHPLTNEEKNEIADSINDTLLKNKLPLDIFTIDDKMMVFFVSKKFKKVAEEMQPGVKVTTNTKASTRSKPIVGTVKTALYYANGVPLIDIQYDNEIINYCVFDDPQGCGAMHAAYWRPVEEVADNQKSHS